jgi:cell division protein FtsI (penicillin-binding protein 3)
MVVSDEMNPAKPAAASQPAANGAKKLSTHAAPKKLQISDSTKNRPGVVR